MIRSSRPNIESRTMHSFLVMIYMTFSCQHAVCPCVHMLSVYPVCLSFCARDLKSSSRQCIFPYIYVLNSSFRASDPRLNPGWCIFPFFHVVQHSFKTRPIDALHCTSYSTCIYNIHICTINTLMGHAHYALHLLV